MADRHIVLGVHLTDRVKEAVAVQRVFTEFGCNIKTRVGLHDADGQVCGPGGVILLEIVGGDEPAAKLRQSLAAIEGVEVQTMTFGEP